MYCGVRAEKQKGTDVVRPFLNIKKINITPG